MAVTHDFELRRIAPKLSQKIIGDAVGMPPTDHIAEPEGRCCQTKHRAIRADQSLEASLLAPYVEIGNIGAKFSPALPIRRRHKPRSRKRRAIPASAFPQRFKDDLRQRRSLVEVDIGLGECLSDIRICR